MENLKKIENNINEGPNRTEVRNQEVKDVVDYLISDEFWNQFKKVQNEEGKDEYDKKTILAIKEALQREIKNIGEKPEKKNIITEQAA